MVGGKYLGYSKLAILSFTVN